MRDHWDIDAKCCGMMLVLVAVGAPPAYLGYVPYRSLSSHSITDS